MVKCIQANLFKCLFSAILLISVIFLMLRMGLNYSGFCWAEKRWLSEDEKIEAAVAHVNQPGKRHIDGKWVERIPYESKEAFLEENPDCCYFGKFPTHFTTMPDGHYAPRPTFIEKVAGYYADVINMQYIEHFTENGVQNSKNIEVQFSLTNCGKGGSF